MVATNARYKLFSLTVSELFERNFPEWSDHPEDRPYETEAIDQWNDQLETRARRRLAELASAPTRPDDERVVKMTRRLAEALSLEGNEHWALSVASRQAVRATTLWALSDESIAGVTRPSREARETIEQIVKSERHRGLDIDEWRTDDLYRNNAANTPNRDQCRQLYDSMLPDAQTLLRNQGRSPGLSIT